MQSLETKTILYPKLYDLSIHILELFQVAKYMVVIEAAKEVVCLKDHLISLISNKLVWCYIKIV